MGLMGIKLDYQYQSVPCSQMFYFYNGGIMPTFSMAEDFFDKFETEYLDAFTAATVDVTVYNKLTYYIHLNSSSRERALTGVTGEIVTTMADRIPPAIVANCKKSVGDSVVVDTNAPYTGGRPIRAGRWYWSGLPLDLMDGDGINGTSPNFAQFSTTLANMNDNLVGIGGGDWTPVVVGFPLAAKLPTPSYPSGKPARPFVVAAITAAAFVEWTKTDLRDPT